MKGLWITVVALALGAGFASAHEGHDMKGMKAAGAQKTVEGELVDLGCYLGHGAKGAKHADCAKMCVKGGQPMGLLEKDGDLILVVGSHSAEKVFDDAKALAGGNAKITGEMTKKGGLNAIIVEKVEKL